MPAITFTASWIKAIKMIFFNLQWTLYSLLPVRYIIIHSLYVVVSFGQAGPQEFLQLWMFRGVDLSVWVGLILTTLSWRTPVSNKKALSNHVC